MQWFSEWASLVWLAVSAVSAPSATPTVIAPPGVIAVDSTLDRGACEAGIGLSAAAACTRAIASGRFSGRELARLHGDRGNELRRFGRLEAALADFDRAVALDPDEPFVWYRRADTHRDRGAFDLAIAGYGEAILRDPFLASAPVRRGLLYERKQLLDLARKDFTTALAIPPKYPGTYAAQATARDRLASMWDAVPSIEASNSNGRFVADSGSFQGLPPH
ncbi:MAG: tetratricopeptide repeat protein [Hyphomicrobiales bacterium]|nr:tetratricopeptide repeat protein [Hyphomicrobiales bacterium]